MTERLRAAAQALVDRWDSPQWGGSAENLRHTGEYITALRAALAEQPAGQEPVAVVSVGKQPWNAGLSVVDLEQPLRVGTKLYTAPQPAKRVPLTDDEIAALWLDSISGPLTATKFARAIERSHGITGETK